MAAHGQKMLGGSFHKLFIMTRHERAFRSGGGVVATAPAASTPLWKNIVAGGLAGVSEILCMYPTDVLKTRQQLAGGKTVGMVQIAKDIITQEGFANLYRGMASPIFAEAPKRAIKFSCNEKYKTMVRCPDGSLPGYRAAMAGAMAGMTEAFINTPFEVIKVQMQAKENLGRYKGVVDCAQSLFKNEGVASGLYKGFEAQLLRNAAWNGVYFGMIGTLKRSMPPPPNCDKSTRLGYDFVAGTIGGTLATCANTPFDVVKSRMQNQLITPGQPPKYGWTIPSMSLVASEEGGAALYKGLGPRLLRLGPGGGIMLVAFNAILGWLEPY